MSKKMQKNAFYFRCRGQGLACSFFCGSFGVFGNKKGASYVLTDVEKEVKRGGAK